MKSYQTRCMVARPVGLFFGGCKTCRKEGFRGTSAAVARPLQGGNGAGVLVEPAQRGLRRRGKGAAGTSKCRKTEAE